MNFLLIRLTQAGILAIALAVIGKLAAAEPEPSPAVVPLTPALIDHFSDQLRTNHPSLRAARATLRAAEHETRSIRSWEDPDVMVGGEGASDEMRAEQGDILYSVEQKLPLFGKPRANREVARSEQGVAEARENLRFQELRRDLAVTLLEAALSAELLRIEAEDHAWITRTTALVSERLAVGDTSQAELLQMQNERSMHLNRVRLRQTELDQARTKLNRQLGKPLDEPWPTLSLPGIAKPVQIHDDLVALSLRHEPRLRVLRQEARTAAASLDKSRRLRHPDIGLNLEGRSYSGDGGFRSGAVLLRFNLPFVNRGRYDSEVARDAARLQASEAETTDYEWSIKEELIRLLLEAERARQEATSYRDEIIPRAERALASVHASWAAGQRAMLRDILDARRQLLEAQRMLAQSTTEQYTMLSEVVLCCGIADFQAFEMIRAKHSEATTPPPTATPIP